MEAKTTGRGFLYYEFEDSNRVSCSIQNSSAAMEDKIWLGANDMGLVEFKAGRSPSWQKVDVPKSIEHHYQANTRMHLNRKQVADLLPVLLRFALTGDIYDYERDGSPVSEAVESNEGDSKP